MRVFVAGASGVLGRRLVPRLVARGHQVTATTAGPARLGLLRQLGAEALVLDGLDAAAVGEAVATARPDMIVHFMTAARATSRADAGVDALGHPDRYALTTNRLRTEGTDHLLAAAQATGTTHFVAQSTASTNGLRQGGWVKTELDPLDPETGTPAHRTAQAVRHLEHTVVNAGGTVLRYGLLYGPGTTSQHLTLVRSRQLPLIGPATGHTSWIHLDDAITATVLAVEQEATGIFNIVDDHPAPAHAWLPHLAACTGARTPRRLPSALARLLTGTMTTTLMTQSRAFSNAKAKEQLHWHLLHPTWHQGFQDPRNLQNAPYAQIPPRRDHPAQQRNLMPYSGPACRRANGRSRP
ncbi:NAD(P)-dependent oxidoreductase [Streptomyces fructofermentans]|uniref:NAD-dependent epimerase/dehydratase family protein n=1 Tax=Streptomyces fructofermentans TaxID=152141 RepID=UPI0034002DD3